MIVDFTRKREKNIDEYMYWFFKTAIHNVRSLIHVAPFSEKIHEYFSKALMSREKGSQMLKTLQEVVQHVPFFILRSERFNIGGAGWCHAIDVKLIDEAGNVVEFQVPIIFINFSVYKYIHDFLEGSMFIEEYPPEKIQSLYSLYLEYGHVLTNEVRSLIDKGMPDLLMDIYELYGIYTAVVTLMAHELGHAYLFYAFGNDYSSDESMPQFIETIFKMLYLDRYIRYLGELTTQICLKLLQEGRAWVFEKICIDPAIFSRHAYSPELAIEEFEKLSDEYPQYSPEELFTNLVDGVEKGEIWIFTFPEPYKTEPVISSFDRAFFNWLRLLQSRKVGRILTDRFVRSVDIRKLDSWEKIMTIQQYKSFRKSFLEETLEIKLVKLVKIEKKRKSRQRK